jgi:hypothetical protein
MDPNPNGHYVLHAEHLADRAELVRLLKEARSRHTRCNVVVPGQIPIRDREYFVRDTRCSWCKQVDGALEGA